MLGIFTKHYEAAVATQCLYFWEWQLRELERLAQDHPHGKQGS